MTEPQVLRTGIAFGEQPRWHEDRLWFSDWGSRQVLAVDLEGHSEVVVDVPSFPCCSGWLPDGSLLVVSGGAYVNGGGFDLTAGEEFEPGMVALVAPDGSARQVADGLEFPNGMHVSADNSTLIVAESYAKRLTAFDIGDDGGLSNRRVWAKLGDDVPDGICIDAEGAVWYADVPNQRCVRVREGGAVLDTVELDRGCFACALGGADRRILFMMATVWSSPAEMFSGPRTGQVLYTEAPAAGARPCGDASEELNRMRVASAENRRRWTLASVTVRLFMIMRWLIGTGMTLLAGALLLSAQLDARSSFATILPALLVGSLGMAITMSPTTAAAISAVPIDNAGAGSAVSGSMRQVGSSLGIAVMGALVATRVAVTQADPRFAAQRADWLFSMISTFLDCPGDQ